MTNRKAKEATDMSDTTNQEDTLPVDIDALSPEAYAAIVESDINARQHELMADYSAELAEDYDPFSVENLSNPWVTPPQVAAMTRDGKGSQNRGAQQLAVDAIASRAYSNWVKVGAPTSWEDIVARGVSNGYWLLPGGQVEEAKGYLKKAADRLGKGAHGLGVRPRYGTVSPREPHMPQDSRVYLPWAIVDKNPTGPRTRSANS